MTTAETIELIRLIVEGLFGGLLVALLTWLIFSLKNIWAAQKDLMQQRIELLKAQMPAAQELAAQVQIIKELAQAKEQELQEKIDAADQEHRQELEKKRQEIIALRDKISEYEQAVEVQQAATAAIEWQAVEILREPTTADLRRADFVIPLSDNHEAQSLVVGEVEIWPSENAFRHDPNGGPGGE